MFAINKRSEVKLLYVSSLEAASPPPSHWRLPPKGTAFAKDGGLSKMVIKGLSRVYLNRRDSICTLIEKTNYKS